MPPDVAPSVLAGGISPPSSSRAPALRAAATRRRTTCRRPPGALGRLAAPQRSRPSRAAALPPPGSQSSQGPRRHGVRRLGRQADGARPSHAHALAPPEQVGFARDEVLVPKESATPAKLAKPSAPPAEAKPAPPAAAPEVGWVDRVDGDVGRVAVGFG